MGHHPVIDVAYAKNRTYGTMPEGRQVQQDIDLEKPAADGIQRFSTEAKESVGARDQKSAGAAGVNFLLRKCPANTDIKIRVVCCRHRTGFMPGGSGATTCRRLLPHEIGAATPARATLYDRNRRKVENKWMRTRSDR